MSICGLFKNVAILITVIYNCKPFVLCLRACAPKKKHWTSNNVDVIDQQACNALPWKLASIQSCSTKHASIG